MKVFLILIFIGIVSCKLSVLSPYDLSSQFSVQNNSISYSVANFGHIPWGRKLIGPVQVAEPFDGCQPISANFELQNQKPFILVTRGNCTFTTKVANAQQAGAALVIIMDNLIEQTENLTMADDGFGFTVSSPSIFIREEDGQIIKDFITKQTDNKAPEQVQPIQQVVMIMKFDIVQFDPVIQQIQQIQKTTVMFALTLDHRQTFKLIREFEPHYFDLKNDNVLFSVYYDLFVCPDCYNNNYTVPQADCLGGGRYCQIDPDGAGIQKTATGRNVIEEQLRQVCIFKTNADKWWKYMDQFDQKCVIPQAFDLCSRQLQKSLGISDVQVEKCVSGSYNLSSSGNRLTQQNLILDDQINFKSRSGVRFYPGAVINNQSYIGAIDGNDVFGEICNSMIKQTGYCRDYFDEFYEPNKNVDSNIVGIVLFVILVMVVFFLFMLFIYRRMVRREMSREMSTQVNQMVSQYISFYDSKDKRSATITA